MANEAFLMSFHRDLLSDRDTQGRFRKAILGTVRPGDRVLDLGAGTGIHSLFACQAGASRVYALEGDRIIDLAREIVRINGFEDRVVFVRGISSQVELPEKVDVIVSNLGFDGALRYLPDARDRFLKPGGRIVPRAMELFGAPVECPEDHRRDVAFWKTSCFGLDLEPMWRVAVNTAHVGRFTPEQFLGEPSRLVRVDLAGTSGGAEGRATYVVTRPGTLHGLATWSVQWPDEETAISTAPPLELPYPLWHHSFFPVESPVRVGPGDRIAFSIRLAAFATAGTFMNWEVGVEGGVSTASRHCTLEGTPLSPETLRKQAPAYRPSLSPRGEAVRMVLALAGDRRPLGRIERETYRRYRNLFRDPRDAAAFVSKVLGDYGA